MSAAGRSPSKADLQRRLYEKEREASDKKRVLNVTKPPRLLKKNAGPATRLSPIRTFRPVRNSKDLTALKSNLLSKPPSSPDGADDVVAEIKPLDQAKPALVPSIPAGKGGGLGAAAAAAAAPAKGSKVNGALKAVVSAIGGMLAPTEFELRKMRPPQIVKWVRAMPGDGFRYMMHAHKFEEIEYHPYDVHVVSVEQIDPNNYFTISKAGVQHVVNGIAEFTALDDWEEEYRIFCMVTKFRFFSQFRMWKQFELWRHYTIGKKQAKAKKDLEGQLFILDGVLQPALLKIRNLCLDVIEMQLCTIDTEKTYTLSEFVEAQHQHVENVSKELAVFREKVCVEVTTRCAEALERNEETLRAASPDRDDALSPDMEKAAAAARAAAAAKYNDDDDGSPAISYTNEAIKAKLCQRLTHFIRLVDYLIVGAMQSLTVESTACLRDRLYVLERSAVPLSEDEEKWAAEDAAAAAAAEEEAKKPATGGDDDDEERVEKVDLPDPRNLPRTLSTSTTLLPWEVEEDEKMTGEAPASSVAIIPRMPVKKRKNRVGAKALKRGTIKVLQTERERQLPLLRIGLSMELDGITASPSRDQVLDEFNALVKLFQEAVIGLDCLLLDEQFNDFTRPLIAGRPTTFPLGSGVDLKGVFENDDALGKYTAAVSRAVNTSYDAVMSFVGVLKPFHKMFQENEGLDIQWLKSTKHSPTFFASNITKYQAMFSVGSGIIDIIETAVFLMDSTALKEILLPSPTRCLEAFQQVLPEQAAAKNKDIAQRIEVAADKIGRELETTLDLVDYVDYMATVEDVAGKLEEETRITTELYELIERFELGGFCKLEDVAEHESLRNEIMKLSDNVKIAIEDVPKKQDQLADSIEKDVSKLGEVVHEVLTRSQDARIFDPETAVAEAIELTQGLDAEMQDIQAQAATLKAYQRKYKFEVTKFTALEEVHAEVRGKKNMWQMVDDWTKLTGEWKLKTFTDIDADEMNLQVTAKFKQAYSLGKALPDNEVVPKLQLDIEKMKVKMPVIMDLRNPNLKQRHWTRINEIVGQEIVHDETFTLALLDKMDAFSHAEELQEVGGSASSEAALDAMLTKLEVAWKDIELPILTYRDSKDIFILGGLDEIQVLLDDSMVTISTISGSRHCAPIKNRVDDMEHSLKLFGETLEEWIECQKAWMYLESIFSAPDIQRQLPAEAKMFLEVDKSFKDAMRKTYSFPNALRAGCTPGFLDMFKKNNGLLDTIQKCLEDYLASKRAVFSRFYFLSNDELLEILSQTRNPLAVQPHMRKCFDMIQKLEFGEVKTDDGEIKHTNDIYAMIDPKGERVGLGKGLKARGNVEVWLGNVEAAMRASLKQCAKDSIEDYSTRDRDDWAQQHCSQVVIMVSQIYWCRRMIECLSSEDPVSALQDFETTCKKQLAVLAGLARGKLGGITRRILGALITIDVHARDIVTSLIQSRCDDITKFEWTKQLRYSWDEEQDTCIVQMSNAVVYYSYEYLGADMRLVVTPLTDKCYLCLLGAVQLDLGGAPAGPAGTGKTETTKDLAKAIGIQCVVFNCSEQMDFKMTGRFFSGLAQSGAWCCFDEFNRINIEVLSVIAQQVLTIRNGKIAGLTRFQFEGREIGLIRTCACFITMNPGYAGRTELPDNLKALFRPMSMMVPDYGLIAEVILYSEGFEEPTSLAKKMVQMYKLCSEQLSQQDHYDFGMRAVKSVLVMAGSLKRSRVGQPEAQVLLTALRDSNLPKFLADDAILFKAILSDLFPGIDLPEHDYGAMQTAIEDCCKAKGLVLDDAQVKKVIQFYETMEVRHGVMLVGPTGGGKTTVYEVLKDALTKLGNDGVEHASYKNVNTYVLNPKSVRMGELYGEVSLATGEWTDGLVSTIVRHCCNQTVEDHQWVMFDGPVDALWIENMNTVLDDNKMLCLANSERIKLTPFMHMCFEVQDLAVASPATVSRCGMVYIDPTELGWKPFFRRWLRDMPKVHEELKAFIEEICLEHLDAVLYNIRKNYICTMEQVDLGKVAGFTSLLEQVLVGPKSAVDLSEVNDDNREALRQTTAMSLTFALVWGIAGSLRQEYFEAFDSYIREKFEDVREIKIPGLGQVFDFYLNYDTSPPTFKKWEEIVPKFEYNPEMPFFDMLVPTVETVKFSWLLSTYLDGNKSVLFTGETGVGKSVIAKDCLDSIAAKDGKLVPLILNFSAQTSSLRTQNIIESKLEKRRKNVLGAPREKKVCIFVDDLNMPKLDTYGSQPPIELLRQYQDFHGLYDREKAGLWKDIEDVTLIAGCAPPGGGRNPVSPRFVRHFAMFAIPKPDDLALKTIFVQILRGFFKEGGFSKKVIETAGSIVSAGVEIFFRIAKELLPTPAKSHYVFNLRDLSKVVQGILQCDSQSIKESEHAAELFFHESLRVFHDRLINSEDKTYFYGMLSEMASKHFRLQVEAETFGTNPILFGDYMNAGAAKEDRTYDKLEVKKIPSVLDEYLDTYNLESNKEMNLVFFMDAVEHVTRISRILRQPRGNALLVGVGGCGKQSLTRMACVMGNIKCFQIEITRGYGVNEFREDLQGLYKSAGTKGEPTVFLFTDTQIVVESFLEDINGILNSGEVPNLIPPEELEQYIGPVRNAAKEAGVPENRDAVYQFFINRVRENLHVVLCMSPVGDSFRSRCRMFPSLVNCCTIDWFTEWPKEALLSVSKRFFEFVDLGNEEMKGKISEMCVTVHTSVQQIAQQFYDELRRKYYTTPTSYLELINLYSSMLETKRRELLLQKDRYANGLKKLAETDELIGTMSVELAELEPVLKVSAEETAALMVRVQADEAAAAKVREVVQREEAIAKKAAAETEAIKADAQADLDEALPALAAAQKALNSLDKKDIQEVKTFATPPEMVQVTMEAVCVLFERKTDWKTAKSLLNEGDFIQQLFDFDKDNVKDKTLKKLKVYMENEKFTAEIVGKTSAACKSLCMWVCAMDLYSKVYRTVEPKRAKLKEAEEALAKTMGELQEKQASLKEVEDKIAILQKQFKESVDKKQELEDSMALTQARMGRAGKLQASLGDEKVRWGESVAMYEKQMVDVVGNVFLASACVAYFGAFTSQYREKLVHIWSERCDELDIPYSKGMGVAEVLSTPYEIRGWNANALPRDQLSTENAVLVTQGRRWPLMIDPQDQANTWIKTMERRNKLQVIKLTQKDFLRTLENAIRTGAPVLLEEVGETLDPSLEPILLKQTFKQGGRLLIRLGDSDVDYDKNFKFYMTSKLPNPHYLPEICIKVTIINFTVTKSGLEDQLLGDTVRLERPDLEEQRTKLILQINEDKAGLKAIEDKILKLLFESEGNILDDEVLIATLGDSKVTSTAIGERLTEAEATELSITTARNKYRPVAKRGSIVFFVIADMGEIDEMYQYSLAYFKTLFILCINESEKSKDLDTRLSSIIEYSTIVIYSNIARGLFEKHNLVFSFMLCCEILRGDNRIEFKSWNYLLRGAGAGERERPPKPELPWVQEPLWRSAVDLSTDVPNHFAGFAQSLLAGPVTVKVGNCEVTVNNMGGPWLDLPPPEEEGVELTKPDEWDAKLHPFEKLVLINALQPHRFAESTEQFVSTQLGKKFVEPPPMDLKTVYQDITKAVPLIFVLSPGSDPMTQFMRFAKDMGFGDKYEAMALGQGQGPIAEKMVAKACKNGTWVFLQNCHLAKSWMDAMEVMIKGFSLPDAEVHDDFRLYLSSAPCSFFPIGVLQNSVKLTNEPPKGLKANVRGSFAGLDQAKFESHPLGLTYRKLIFGLCFFHANIQERKKFGPLGWNIRYDFSDTDRETTLANLAIFLEEQGRVPWDSLSFLISEVYYGGRVTDSWDERTLRTILRRFFKAESLDADFKYSASGIYYPAGHDSMEEYNKYVDTFPFADDPDIFGLHPNANIAYQTTEGATILGNVLGVQPRLASGAGEKSPDDVVFEVAEMIQSKLRSEILDLDLAKEGTFDRDEHGQVASLSTVLKQEVERFNKMLLVLWDVLKNIKKAIKGLVVMSLELDQVYKAFINNQVPPLWKKASYPSLRPLGSWVSDLVLRLSFIEDWMLNGAPKSFWLSGFYFPQSFLTGTLQTHARKYKLPIDQLTYKFTIFDNVRVDPAAYSEEGLPEITDGVLVHGVFMEAMRWDDENSCLTDSLPGEMHAVLPVMHMLPEPNWVPPESDYVSPMYKTSTRAGVLSTTGHSTNFVVAVHLPSSQTPDFWINRGAALLTQLDT